MYGGGAAEICASIAVAKKADEVSQRFADSVLMSFRSQR